MVSPASVGESAHNAADATSPFMRTRFSPRRDGHDGGEVRAHATGIAMRKAQLGAALVRAGLELNCFGAVPHPCGRSCQRLWDRWRTPLPVPSGSSEGDWRAAESAADRLRRQACRWQAMSSLSHHDLPPSLYAVVPSGIDEELHVVLRHRRPLGPMQLPDRLALDLRPRLEAQRLVEITAGKQHRSARPAAMLSSSSRRDSSSSS
jgi:hypothetical protein